MKGSRQTIPVVVPDLGDAIDEVAVAVWHKNEGERVEADEDLLEVVTDKASFHIPSPASGVLAQIRAPAGSSVKVGAVLGLVRVSADD